MTNVIFAIVVLGVLGAVFGLLLSVASKIFEVKKDPREEAILSHLAGANCGGCGYPGCGGCAAAILAGDAPVTACAPAGAENAAAIAEIMGMAAPTGEREVAFVRCTGGIFRPRFRRACSRRPQREPDFCHRRRDRHLCDIAYPAVYDKLVRKADAEPVFDERPCRKALVGRVDDIRLNAVLF